MRWPRKPKGAERAKPLHGDRIEAIRRDLKWLAVVIAVLLVVAALAAPFIGRVLVWLVKGFFNSFVFPGGG